MTYEIVNTHDLDDLFVKDATTGYYKGSRLGPSSGDNYTLDWAVHQNYFMSDFFKYEAKSGNTIYPTGYTDASYTEKAAIILSEKTYGPYSMTINLSVLKNTSYNLDSYNIFGVILECNELVYEGGQEDKFTSLVFLMSDAALGIHSSAPHGLRCSNSDYVRFYVAIYNHVTEKFTYIEQLTSLGIIGDSSTPSNCGFNIENVYKTRLFIDRIVYENGEVVYRFGGDLNNDNVITLYSSLEDTYSDIDHSDLKNIIIENTNFKRLSRILISNPSDTQKCSTGTWAQKARYNFAYDDSLVLKGTNPSSRPYTEWEPFYQTTRGNDPYKRFGFIIFKHNMVDKVGILPCLTGFYGQAIYGKRPLYLTVSLDDWRYGQPGSNIVLKGNSGDGTPTYKYKKASEDDTKYTTTRPILPGDYVIKVEVPETKFYESGEATDTFSILKRELSISLSMSSYTVNGTPSEPVLSGNTENGEVTYEYKLASADDSTYSTTKPTSLGDYIVRATVAETTNYESKTATATFSVTKEKTNPTVSMANYYDTTIILPDPLLTNNTSDGAVTYSYKLTSAPDTAYTSVKPTALGNYTVRAVIAETDTYEGKTVTSTFSVLHKAKQEIKPTVSLQNFHIDELAELLNNGNVPIPTVTDNKGNAPVKFMYKRKSKPSTEYTNVFPNDIGAYDIKAYIHESDEYFDAECFGTFSIYNPNVDERDGTTVVSVYSNVKAGNVTDIDTKLYAEYKKNSDTIKDKMSLFTIDSDNRYKVLLQGAVNNANEVTVESSISAKIDFIIEKCVIMGNRIICYTDSKQPSYRVVNDILPGTAFTQMAINTQEENDFIIENMPDGHYGYIDVPMYEQYPIMSGSEIASYDYRRIGTNKVSVDNGYAFDRLNSAYYALPEDVPVFSSDEVVITKNGWSISLSGVCRQILTLPLKHIKDYFPDSRIYYETQTTI